MTVQDQLGRQVILKAVPQRIVSLVPSITELLCDLGLESQLVGCTKFCIHPAHLRKRIKVVGGTKSVHLDRIEALQPDLIIANKEENSKEEVDQLIEAYPVWVSKVKTIEDSFELIEHLGKICDCRQEAERLSERLRKSLFVDDKKLSPKKVAYLIWKSPYMTVGGDTYIHNMLELHNFQNVFAERLRYPQVSIEEIKKQEPDLVFLSSEPFPFKKDHLREIQLLLPQSKVVMVDGEYFSWYGSRQLYLQNYIQELNDQIVGAN